MTFELQYSKSMAVVDTLLLGVVEVQQTLRSTLPQTRDLASRELCRQFTWTVGSTKNGATVSMRSRQCNDSRWWGRMMIGGKVEEWEVLTKILSAVFLLDAGYRHQSKQRFRWIGK
jgi:hypothetical protein